MNQEKNLLEYKSKRNRQIEILFKMARLMRNTDGLFPSSWGSQAGSLLNQLRALDQERYDAEVMSEVID
jgi:hypothetical protein